MSDLTYLYNEGEVHDVPEGYLMFPKGKYRIRQIIDGRIQTEDLQTGELTVRYPIDLILNCPLPSIPEDETPMACPICWGRAKSLVHLNYGDCKGEWVQMPCRFCDGAGQMSSKDAMQAVRAEIADREARSNGRAPCRTSRKQRR